MHDFTAIDAFIASQTRGLDMACRPGCSWCCHQLVIVTCRDDVRRILAAARARLDDSEWAAFEDTVRRQAADIARIGHDAAQALRWTCPLLRAGLCLVYDVRPVACRSVSSPDAGCCRAMMEAERFDALTPAQQTLAGEIGERAMRLQLTINDRRPVDGAKELRQWLVELLDEERGRAASGTDRDERP
jgi:hypothetical protein